MQKKLLKNISYSLGANIINFLASAFIAFIVPKFLGVKEYAYWQLYSFYIGYKGMMHLGWLDGIYLKYGGETYQSLDKQLFHDQFVLLFIMECIFGGLIIGLGHFYNDQNKRFVFAALGIAVVIYLLNTFFQFILQTTNEIVEYSKCVFAERLIYACIVIGILLAGGRSFKWMILADLTAGVCTFIILSHKCNDIFRGKIKNIYKALKEGFDNIRIGSKLLFGNIAGTLIIGIARQMIEVYWGVETFGKVSLALSVSNMLMVLISAISLVLYPLIRNINYERICEIYPKILCMTKIFIFVMLLFYFPCKKILLWWLPSYQESFTYMALLFPICFFDGLYYLLVATYLKAFRKENVIMFINWGTVLMEIVLLYLSHSVLVYVILTILLSIGFRCYVGLFCTSMIVKTNFTNSFVFDMMMIGCFLLGAWNAKNSYIFIYILLLTIYLTQNRHILNIFKNYKGNKL